MHEDNDKTPFAFWGKFGNRMPRPQWSGHQFKAGPFPWQWFGQQGPRAERGDL